MKLTFTSQRILDILQSLPTRVARITQHFFVFFSYLNRRPIYGVKLSLVGRFALWFGELFFLFLDLIGIPEFYEIVNLWFKTNVRGLKPGELRWAKTIFGDALPYARIRLDERAYLGPRQYQFCYVSFCVINSWHTMSPAVFIHELVHVWQFQQYGSPYILRALLAQQTSAGYDYGGIIALERAKDQKQGLTPFNYEQQAAIVEDYFRLKSGAPGRWQKIKDEQKLETYRYFINAMMKNKR